MKWIEQNEAGGSRKRAAQEVLHATQGGNPSVSLIAESVNVVKDGTAGTAGTHGKIWVRHVAGELENGYEDQPGYQFCSLCRCWLASGQQHPTFPAGSFVYGEEDELGATGHHQSEVPRARFILPCRVDVSKMWGAGTHLPRVYRLAFYKKAA